MYENIAWKNFCKTGSLESFLEYKKIMEINNVLTDDSKRCNEEDIFKEKGEFISELDKIKRYNNKRNNL